MTDCQECARLLAQVDDLRKDYAEACKDVEYLECHRSAQMRVIDGLKNDLVMTRADRNGPRLTRAIRRAVAYRAECRRLRADRDRLRAHADAMAKCECGHECAISAYRRDYPEEK
jgi:hypothetical protein